VAAHQLEILVAPARRAVAETVPGPVGLPRLVDCVAADAVAEAGPHILLVGHPFPGRAEAQPTQAGGLPLAFRDAGVLARTGHGVELAVRREVSAAVLPDPR